MKYQLNEITLEIIFSPIACSKSIQINPVEFVEQKKKHKKYTEKCHRFHNVKYLPDKHNSILFHLNAAEAVESARTRAVARCHRCNVRHK